MFKRPACHPFCNLFFFLEDFKVNILAFYFFCSQHANAALAQKRSRLNLF